MRKKLILTYILSLTIISLLLLGCSESYANNDASDSEKSIASDVWVNAELTDVATGTKFKISDFKGKPILLESFAVWCPTCTRQQRNIKELHEEVGDAVISVSLDTDPNEDASKVKEHIELNGFDWLYVVSPVEVTKGLIDQFGVGVVNAPSAPVVLICEDLSTRMLKRGLKSVDELKEEMEKGC